MGKDTRNPPLATLSRKAVGRRPPVTGYEYLKRVDLNPPLAYIVLSPSRSAATLE